jgi:thioredoxin reductase
MYEVAIIGAGPAGLSAALVLGRCRRRVLVCDNGRPRNAAATALHGYLSRDGCPPLELLRLGREELRPYGITVREDTVTGVAPGSPGFVVALATGEHITSQVVLIATGVHDRLPDIPGLAECYGTSVHHCPYCDGWEVRDRRLVVLGSGRAATGLALSLKTWSTRVTVCGNGSARLTPVLRAQLAGESIEVRDSTIAHIDHDAGRLRRVVFADGASLECDALFFTTAQAPQSSIARSLGCEFTRQGVVKTDHLGQTCVPGVYVVGDASRDVQFVVVAAAEGAKAAVSINKQLQAREGLAVAPHA